MKKVIYTEDLRLPEGTTEKEACEYLKLARIPDFRGMPLHLDIVPGPDAGIYRAKVWTPERRFAGEFYFPMSTSQSYQRALRECLEDADSTKLLYITSLSTLVHETGSPEGGDSHMEYAARLEGTITTVGKLIEQIAPEFSINNVSELRRALRSRLLVFENTNSRVREQLLKLPNGNELVEIGAIEAIALSKGVVTADNFNFYRTGERPPSEAE